MVCLPSVSGKGELAIDSFLTDLVETDEDGVKVPARAGRDAVQRAPRRKKGPRPEQQATLLAGVSDEARVCEWIENVVPPDSSQGGWLAKVTRPAG